MRSSCRRRWQFLHNFGLLIVLVLKFQSRIKNSVKDHLYRRLDRWSVSGRLGSAYRRRWQLSHNFEACLVLVLKLQSQIKNSMKDHLTAKESWFITYTLKLSGMCLAVCIAKTRFHFLFIVAIAFGSWFQLYQNRENARCIRIPLMIPRLQCKNAKTRFRVCLPYKYNAGWFFLTLTLYPES